MSILPVLMFPQHFPHIVCLKFSNEELTEFYKQAITAGDTNAASAARLEMSTRFMSIGDFL